jgi:hypothetical protein
LLRSVADTTKPAGEQRSGGPGEILCAFRALLRLRTGHRRHRAMRVVMMTMMVGANVHCIFKANGG